MHRFLVAEKLVADRARRNEAVRACAVELDEQAGSRHPRNPALKRGADPVGEVVRDQPVVGLALGLHGAPLGGGNLRRDLAQRAAVLVGRRAVIAEVLRADQRAMHGEVGVAADR